MIIGLVSAREAIERKFETEIPDRLEYLPNYNLREDMNCLFLISGKFCMYSFGMTPSWSKEPVKVYMAQVENPKIQHRDGILRKDIILDPRFRKAIRSQRGILPVDYFIVPGKNGELFLVFSPDRNKRPFALACIWDSWKKEITDELTHGFAILTVPAFGPFLEAGIEYMPLVLDDYRCRKWIRPALSLTEVTGMMLPEPKTSLNAFRISSEIRYNMENHKDLIIRQGDFLIPEKTQPMRAITDKFQKKKVHDDPGFHWGYLNIK